MTDENREEEENLGQEVDELLEEGLTQKQIEQRGYSPSLVRQRVRRRTKAGKAPPGGGRDGAVAMRKEKESVLPEWIETDVANLFDGTSRDQQIFRAGMSVPIMGLRLFSEAIQPLTDLLTAWQKGQAEAAREASASGEEIARQAAGQAAAGAVNELSPKIDALGNKMTSSSQNPLQSAMMDVVTPYFRQLFGGLMGSMMGNMGPRNQAPPGEQGATAPSGPQIQQGAEYPGQQVGSQPSPGLNLGPAQASDDEIEEAFDE